MQIKTFTISIFDNGEQENKLNSFLRANKILVVDQQLGTCNGESCWCFCVRYLEKSSRQDLQKSSSRKREKIDYKEVLTPTEFEKFSRLRSIRKQISIEDAIPAFAVFTDAQLAELSKIGDQTRANWGQISGVGPKTIDRYFERFVNLEKKHDAEKNRSTDGENS